MECKTVKVASPISDENPHGYIVINETDVTEEHELFEPEPEVVVRMKRKYTKSSDAQ